MVERWWDEPISRHANIFLAAAGDQSRTQAMRMYSTGVRRGTRPLAGEMLPALISPEELSPCAG